MSIMEPALRSDAVNRQTILFILLAVLLAMASAWWFFNTYEYRIEEKDVGFQGEARRNEYLAAERFLEKVGMEIKGLATILDLKKELPGLNDILFIPTGRYDLAAKKVEELLTWVKQGGHLVVRARQGSINKPTIQDALFDTLGVETHRKQVNNLFARNNRTIIDVHVNDTIENKQVEFDTNGWMKDKALNELVWQVDGENGSHLLEYKFGSGTITILSDIRFLENAFIDKHDHASFLYTIVQLDQSKSTLWIIRSDDMPSLFSIIKQKAPAAVGLFTVFIVLWLWYGTRRFGPLLQRLKPARRSLGEHITASGYYQWRNHNRSALFMITKTAVLDRIAQTRPFWAKLDDMKLAAKLGEIAEIHTGKVLFVLRAEKVESELEFTRFIQVLSGIRKKL